MNISSNNQYCLEFKYLITGSITDICMYFYGKTWKYIKKQSKLFSTFCIPNKQSKFHWYYFNILLPENITMVI